MNKNELVRSVRSRLEKVGHGIEFEVVADGVRRENSWWYVPVLATRNGKEVPREFTVNIFANIEDELEQEQNLSVLFIPAVADPVPAKSRGK